jgi:predicted ester cyclase
VAERSAKEVVARFLADGWDRAANRWDVDVIAECFDVEGYWSHTWEADLVETGRRQGAFFRQFSREREVLADDLVAEGDLVVHRTTYRTRATGEVLGVAGDDRPVTVTHIEMWRVTNGKIIEHWGGLGEAHHLYAQLTDEG